MLFPQSSPLLPSTSPIMRYWQKQWDRFERLFILSQVCVPFSVREPRKARWRGRVNTGLPHAVGPQSESTYGVCVGQTVMLQQLIYGWPMATKFPRKLFLPSRARDTPRNLIRSKRKEMKEVSAHWCQTCRAGSEGAHCCRETGGQLTLQAPSHTSTRKSKSMQIKSHIFLFIFCLIIITHGCSTVDTFGTVMAFCGTRWTEHFSTSQQQTHSVSNSSGWILGAKAVKTYRESHSIFTRHINVKLVLFLHRENPENNKCYTQM